MNTLHRYLLLLFAAVLAALAPGCAGAQVATPAAHAYGSAIGALVMMSPATGETPASRG
jgi:hypothetical protein